MKMGTKVCSGSKNAPSAVVVPAQVRKINIVVNSADTQQEQRLNSARMVIGLLTALPQKDTAYNKSYGHQNQKGSGYVFHVFGFLKFENSILLLSF